MKLYNEAVSENGKRQFILSGILKKNTFIAQIHLEKFIKELVYTNGGFVTVLECKNDYIYNKVKRILDSNLRENCFVDENYEFKFKLVG